MDSLQASSQMGYSKHLGTTHRVVVQVTQHVGKQKQEFGQLVATQLATAAASQAAHMASQEVDHSVERTHRVEVVLRHLAKVQSQTVEVLQAQTHTVVVGTQEVAFAVATPHTQAVVSVLALHTQEA